MHIPEEAPPYYIYREGHGARSYQDHGARGRTVKFIVRRVTFRVKYVKPVDIGTLGLHGWPWLCYSGPSDASGHSLKHRLVSVTTDEAWERLQLGRTFSATSPTCWPWLRLSSRQFIKQCVFLTLVCIIIVHSQLINMMIHHFRPGINGILSRL